MTAVESRLGRRVFVREEDADVRLVARVQKFGDAWNVALDLRSRRDVPLGTRDVRSRGAECGGVAQSLPLVVTLLIDLPRSDVESANARVTPPPAAPEFAPTSQAEAQPVSMKQSALRWKVVAAGEVAAGLLPAAAFGGHMAFGVATRGGWSLELAGGAFAPSSQATPLGGARFTYVFGAVNGCMPLVEGSLSLGFCVGVRGGSLRAEGTGFDRNAVDARPFFEATAGGRADVALGRFLFLRLEIGAAAPAREQSYGFRSSTGARVELFQPAAASLRGALGVGARLF